MRCQGARSHLHGGLSLGPQAGAGGTETRGLPATGAPQVPRSLAQAAQLLFPEQGCPGQWPLATCGGFNFHLNPLKLERKFSPLEALASSLVQELHVAGGFNPGV